MVTLGHVWIHSTHNVQPTTVSINVSPCHEEVLDLDNYEHPSLGRKPSHSLKTNIDFYKKHNATVELAKISKLLIIVMMCQVSQFAGKMLTEIEDGKNYSISKPHNETSLYNIEMHCIYVFIISQPQLESYFSGIVANCPNFHCIISVCSKYLVTKENFFRTYQA